MPRFQLLEKSKKMPRAHDLRRINWPGSIGRSACGQSEMLDANHPSPHEAAKEEVSDWLASTIVPKITRKPADRSSLPKPAKEWIRSQWPSSDVCFPACFEWLNGVFLGMMLKSWPKLTYPKICCCVRELTIVHEASPHVCRTTQIAWKTRPLHTPAQHQKQDCESQQCIQEEIIRPTLTIQKIAWSLWPSNIPTQQKQIT